MPSTVAVPGQSAKRKRKTSETKPSKRARSESNEEDDVQAQILLLESQILESKKNYNNIAILIKILRDDGEDADKSFFAAIRLCRVFTVLMATGEMTKRPGTSEKEAIVVKWLKERYSEYKTTLLEWLGDDAISSQALTFCMRLLKSEGQHLYDNKEYIFPTQFLTDIVRILLKPGSDGNARKVYCEKFVQEHEENEEDMRYEDIRFFTLETVDLVTLLPYQH